MRLHKSQNIQTIPNKDLETFFMQAVLVVRISIYLSLGFPLLLLLLLQLLLVDFDCTVVALL